MRDGVCEPIPPSEFTHWAERSGEYLRPSEYAIMRAMDQAYCEEMNKELADFRAREDERRAAEAAKKK